MKCLKLMHYIGRIGLLPIVMMSVGLYLGFSVCSSLRSLGITFTIWHTPVKHVSWPDVKLFGTSETHYTGGEDAVAQDLARKVKVLCWIMTGPKSHDRAQHVKATWGRRCNILLFMSTEHDRSLPTVKLSVREGYHYLWGKTKQAMKYVYDHHLQRADWFFKADDDTYAVMENLRYMLSAFNTSDPLYFGLRYKRFVRNGYMSGGAGYVLSREALKRFVERALPDKDSCKQDDTGPEDLELGECLQNVGVHSVDTRDSFGRGRFFHFLPERYIIPHHMASDFWYWSYIYYSFTPGFSCCSDTAVTFHYVSQSQMHVLEYLIYQLRPYGVSHRFKGKPGFTEPAVTELQEPWWNRLMAALWLTRTHTA